MIHSDVPSDGYKGPIEVSGASVFQAKDENVIFVYSVPTGGGGPSASSQVGVELRRYESIRIGAGMAVYLKAMSSGLGSRVSQTQVEA